VNSTGNLQTHAQISRRYCIVIAALLALALGACSSNTPKPNGAGGGSAAATASTVPGGAATATSTPDASPAAFTAAATLLHNGDYEAAAAAYGTLAVAAFDPEAKAHAMLNAGIALSQAGDAGPAIAILRKANSTAAAGSDLQRRAAYLLAVRLDERADAEDADAAAKALAPFVVTPADAFLPYVQLEYARAVSMAGDPAAADAAWDAMLSQPALPDSLRLQVYQARLASAQARGDNVATRTWMANTVAITGSPAMRAQLAALAKAAGDTAAFAAQLQAIVNASPGSAQAPNAIAQLRGAGYTVTAGDEGLVDYRHGLYAAAIEVLTAGIAEPGLPAATLAFRTFYLAASYEDSGDTTNAVVFYDKAAGIVADSAYVHRAKYWAARVIEGTGDVRSAANRYAELVRNGPAGEFTGESAFRAGYTLLRAGQPQAAVDTWRSLGVTSDARLLYWEGRTYADLGDKANASDSYARAAAVSPYDFYSIEAGRELGTVGVLDVSFRQRALPASIDWASISTWLATVVPGSASPVVNAAMELSGVGLRDAANDALLEAADGADAWQMFALLREASDCGLPDTAARLALRLQSATGVASNRIPTALMQLEYPLDYVALLQNESRVNGIDPLFMAAVIRQESLWDASAGSGAGALGLTQVIPPTGESIAAALGMKDFAAADLFRPVVSLKFGAYYLGQQMKAYGGNVLAAMAAYNAGPGNAARWLESLPAAATAADFAETVDFEETAHYVEVILEHYAHYEAAYGGKLP
jgi:soluble lytic murein transglycosylase